MTSRVGTVLKNGGAAGAIVTALFLIGDRLLPVFFRPLNAEVQLISYRVAPDARARIDEMLHQASDTIVLAKADTLARVVANLEHRAFFRLEAKYALQAHVDELQELRSALGDYEAVWLAEVENSGARTLHAVTLLLPGAQVVALQLQGRPETVDTVDGRIILGDLSPTERVKVTAWSRSNLRPFLDGARLVHEGGVGRIDWLEPTGGSARTAQDVFRLIGVIVMLAGVVMGISWLLGNATSMGNARSPGS